MFSQRLSQDEAPSDAALLGRARAGDAAAWQSLAAKFRPLLRALAAREMPMEVNARLDASDVVQQTLAEASEMFATFHGNSFSELYAWLAAILRHNISDAVRRHVRAQRRSTRVECRLDDSAHEGGGWAGVCAADQTSPSMAVARSEVELRLSRAIEDLPARQRAAVRMRHFEGRPLAEIARELNCSVEAAAATLTRGLRRLGERLRNAI